MSMYDDLLKAARLDPARSLIRITTTYEPAGGPGSKVYPPTFPLVNGSPYALEERRRDGGDPCSTVLLDQVPSQANRCEEALLRAYGSKRIRVPLIEVESNGQAPVTLTSLQAPHRYADAYLRDSLLGKERFDDSEVGKAMLSAQPADATALYRYDPGSLVYGAWNSHRKGQQTKFPRIYSSEITGWDPVLGTRRAGRLDPNNLQGAAAGSGEGWEFLSTQEKAAARKESKDKAAKQLRLSEIGHGHIAPSEAHGGVTISDATRFATISFAALDRLGFGIHPFEAQVAARVALAAYALMADRLAFGGATLWLRSGCELVAKAESIAWIGRGNVATEFAVTTDEAVSLFETARDTAAKAGIPMELEPVRLTANKSLTEAIDFSLTRATDQGVS